MVNSCLYTALILHTLPVFIVFECFTGSLDGVIRRKLFFCCHLRTFFIRLWAPESQLRWKVAVSVLERFIELATNWSSHKEVHLKQFYKMWLWVVKPSNAHLARACLHRRTDVQCSKPTINISIMPVSQLSNRACYGSKLPPHYFLSSANHLAELMTEYWTTNHISTDCWMTIIGNFQYRRS